MDGWSNLSVVQLVFQSLKDEDDSGCVCDPLLDLHPDDVCAPVITTQQLSLGFEPWPFTAKSTSFYCLSLGSSSISWQLQ